MERRRSPLAKSWLPAAKNIGAGLVGIVLGTAIMVAVSSQGASKDNVLLIFFGAVFALGGAGVVVWMLASKRGGYGPCPVCQIPIEASTGDQRDLLCGGCGAYLDAAEDELVTIENERTYLSPTFAAPTPWPDIRVLVPATVSFSFEDFAADKIGDLGRKKSVRPMDARWPAGCCVCGQPETRRAQMSVAGTTGAKRVILVAVNVPYCSQHTDGIDFKNVSLNSRQHSDRGSFGIRFRSHGYREAFRRINQWAWAK